MSFHVVCHDCTFEAVTETEEAADLGTHLHDADFDHEVEYAEVATDGGRSLEDRLTNVDGIGQATAETIATKFDSAAELRKTVSDLPPGFSPTRLSKLDGFGPDRARSVAEAIDDSGILDEDR